MALTTLTETVFFQRTIPDSHPSSWCLGSWGSHVPRDTLQGINISHLGKRKIIFKMPFLGDILVSWRVHQLQQRWRIDSRVPWNFILLMVQKCGKNQLVGDFSHYLQGFSTIPGGWEWDFWTINSMTTNPPSSCTLDFIKKISKKKYHTTIEVQSYLLRFGVLNRYFFFLKRWPCDV